LGARRLAPTHSSSEFSSLKIGNRRSLADINQSLVPPPVLQAITSASKLQRPVRGIQDKYREFLCLAGRECGWGGALPKALTGWVAGGKHV
jgi:hypothetical protein